MAAFAALLSGLCYTQLVVDMPVAGGATFYMANIFGELVSWCVFKLARLGQSACAIFIDFSVEEGSL